jgi:hypothetical protein
MTVAMCAIQPQRPPGASPRVTKRRAETRASLIEAAFRVFAKKGPPSPPPGCPVVPSVGSAGLEVGDRREDAAVPWHGGPVLASRAQGLASRAQGRPLAPKSAIWGSMPSWLLVNPIGTGPWQTRTIPPVRPRRSPKGPVPPPEGSGVHCGTPAQRVIAGQIGGPPPPPEVAEGRFRPSKSAGPLPGRPPISCWS